MKKKMMKKKECLIDMVHKIKKDIDDFIEETDTMNLEEIEREWEKENEV